MPNQLSKTLSPLSRLPSTASLMKERRLSGYCILVVDDDAPSLRLLAIFLGQLGATVIDASSATEATSLMVQHSPHLIVSDMRLPGMSGQDLMRWVRSRLDIQGRQIPAIALSADALSRTRQEALDAGFQCFLSKPFLLPDLILEIYQLLRIVCVVES